MKKYLCVCTKVFFDTSLFQQSFEVVGIRERDISSVCYALKEHTTDEFDSILVVVCDDEGHGNAPYVVAHHQDRLGAYYAEQQRMEVGT